MHRFIFLLLAVSCLATAPRYAAAQEGASATKITARTQFVLKNGEVVQRDGNQLTPLTQNVRLANGVKINYRNGIVEMPADKVYPQGKRITLQEGDFVRPDGGIVFATPASATAARGDAAKAANATYEKYVQKGANYPGLVSQMAAPAPQLTLLQKKVDLLNQKVTLLSQGRTDLPDTKAIDDELTQLDTQLAAPVPAPTPVPASAPAPNPVPASTPAPK
jgi:TolA-binding protein